MELNNLNKTAELSLVMSKLAAKVCHSVNKVYCELIGDYSQSDWEDAPDWQRTSAVEGVKHYLNNPNSSPADMHESWMKSKIDDGWKYGPEKDADKKEHPCIVPYEKLPIEQRVKDDFFIAVCKSFL